jgi:hypothetical protein
MKEVEVGRACSMHGDEKSVQSLVQKHEGKRPVGRRSSSWKDNIKVNLKDNVAMCGLDSCAHVRDRR